MMTLIIKANKNFSSSLHYFVAFQTRHELELLNDENINIFKSTIFDYLEKNDITIHEYKVKDKSIVILDVYAPPVLSAAEIIFNIKRLSAAKLVKQNNKFLSGEHAFWTRQYIVASKEEEINQLLQMKE